MEPVNRLTSEPSYEQLVATTGTDHLLADEGRRRAEQARDAFEDLGREMDRKRMRETMYPVYYESVREQLAGGTSPEDLRTEMQLFATAGDEFDASILREAYEDALAGRPPRYEVKPSS